MKLLEYWPFFVGCAAGALLALVLSSMLRLPETVSLIGFVLLTVIGGGLSSGLRKSMERIDERNQSLTTHLVTF